MSTAVIRAKDYEQSREDYRATERAIYEHAQLSEENRRQQKEIQALKLDYDSAMKRVCDLEDRIKNITAIIEIEEEVQS